VRHKRAHSSRNRCKWIEVGGIRPTSSRPCSYKRANHRVFVCNGTAILLKKRAEHKARPCDALFYGLSLSCLWLTWPCHRLHNACDSIHSNAITLPWPLCFRINMAPGRFFLVSLPGAHSNQNDSTNKFANQNRRAEKHSALF